MQMCKSYFINSILIKRLQIRVVKLEIYPTFFKIIAIIRSKRKIVSNDVHRSSFLCVYMIMRSLLPIYRIFIILINVKILFTSNCMYTHLCTYPNERLPRNRGTHCSETIWQKELMGEEFTVNKRNDLELHKMIY